MKEAVVPKRRREEKQGEEDIDCEEDSKRHKPFNHILSLLESEEDESTQDLSPLITTLEHEITTCASNSDTLLSPPKKNGRDNLTATTTTTATNLEDSSTSTTHSNNGVLKEDEEDDKESVMRHLLEASDDELGIPNRSDGLLDFGEDGFNGGDMFSSLCDGFWELEDETANYYTLLQSELFL